MTFYDEAFADFADYDEAWEDEADELFSDDLDPNFWENEE